MADLGQTVPIDIGIGIVSNLLFTLLLVGLVYLVSWGLSKRAVHRFFGGGAPDQVSIQIRLSSMLVQPGGTKGTDTLRRGFSGPALMGLEYEYALRLAAAIETRPVARLLTRMLPGMTSADNPGVCQIKLSPTYYDVDRPVAFASDQALADKVGADLRGGTFILVGAPIYNVMTRYVLDQSRHRFLEGSAVPERGIDVKGHKLYRRETRELGGGQQEFVEYALVLKRPLFEDGPMVLVCAGTCPAATVAALEQLTRWRELAKLFKGSTTFEVIYEVITLDKNAEPRSVQRVWSVPGRN